jgi:hypothetical protein
VAAVIRLPVRPEHLRKVFVKAANHPGPLSPRDLFAGITDRVFLRLESNDARCA